MSEVVEKSAPFRGFVTTDYVMDETITLIRHAHSHAKATEFAEAALASRVLKIVYVDKIMFSSALELFRKNSDKTWSFTDCTSFAVMNSLGVATAFSFDRHFRQAGFETLP